MAYAQRMGFAQNFNSKADIAPGSSGVDNHTQQEDWNALRDELETLLEQVSARQQQEGLNSHPQNSPAAPATASLEAHQTPSQQMPSQRFQAPPTQRPTEPDRREQALLSVQRAVERFNEPYEAAPMPAHPQNQLQSAIEQIRASQGQLGTRAQRQNRPVAPVAANRSEVNRLNGALEEINHRFARLEKGIGSQQNSGQALQDMAIQIEQLSSVVELLANSVGERGQIKRVEAQIAKLADALNSGPELDFSSINQRLDVLSGAFEQLTALQTRQLEQASNDLGSEQMDAIEQGVRNLYERFDAFDLSKIETCVRSVYNRLDTLENSLGTSKPAIEQLSTELAAFAKAMQTQDGAPLSPTTIAEHIDALNTRIVQIENEGGPVRDLKMDMAELSSAVLGAMEPRFSALENQLSAIKAKPDGATGDLSELSVEQLEAQIRQLSEKMDKTSSDLSGLHQLYQEGSAQESSPDFSAIADLVAQRTGEAIRVAQAASPGPVDQDALDELEQRLSSLFETQEPALAEAGEYSAVQASIDQVNQRLARLEHSLSGEVGNKTLPRVPSDGHALSLEADLDISELQTDQPEAILPPEPGQQRRPMHPGLSEPFGGETHAPLPQSDEGMEESEGGAPLPARSDRPGKNHLLAALDDAMPRSPTAETELNAPAFAPPEAEVVPVPNALRTQADDLLVLNDILSEEEALPGGAPTATGRIKLPQFTSENTTPPPAPTSSFDNMASTRAAKDDMVSKNKTHSADTNNVEDEREKVSRSTFIEAARRAAKTNNPEKFDNESQSLIAKALARFQKKQSDEKDPVSSSATPDETALGVTDGARRALPGDSKEPNPTPAPELDQMDVVEVEESFLSRHRQPILLVATLAAVSMLALNLISQRFNPGDVGSNNTASEQASVVKPPAATSPQPVAPPAEGISQSDQSGPGPNDVVGSIELTRGNESADVRMIDPALVSDMPPSLDLASLSVDQFNPAPASTGLPAEAIGPMALRQAAAGGDPRAQFEVAAIFAEGRAIAQDLGAAALWYERSAATGFAPAAYRLGNMYENGVGVEKNLELARIWYQRAADAGNRMSMHNLASLLASGGLGEQKFSEAALWFEQAAALGLRDSQFNLGMLYARGLGVPQDLDASFKWFSIAATGGDEDAARARDDVLRSLDAQTVTRLQAEIDSWHPQDMNLQTNFAPIGTWSDSFDPGPTIDDRDIVMRVQAALNKLGFDTGTPDGIAGAKTEQAIVGFERATGMSESGKINPRLLSVLGSQPV